MDPALREPVSRPQLPPLPTEVGALASFSIQQEATLNISEGRTKEAVKALDDCTTANHALHTTLGAIKP